MKPYSIVVMIVLCILSYSCKKDDISVFHETSSFRFPYLIPHSHGTIDEEEAKLIIKNLYVKSNTKSLNSLNIREVLTITDHSGAPAIYAINLDEGYYLISAVKTYFPIIATVEKGAYNPNNVPKGLKSLIESYIIDIESLKTAGTDTLSMLRSIWREYEYYDLHFPRTKSDEDDLYNLVIPSMHEWENEGFEFSSLDEGIPNGLSEYEYQNYISIARDYANPSFDYMVNSFILSRTEYYGVGMYEPIIEARWGFENFYLLNGYDSPSAAVAIAQIMKHFRFPNSYNWDDMYNMYDSYSSATLIAELSTQLNTVFITYTDGSKCSIVYPSDISYCLTNNGYSFYFGYHNISRIKNSISNGYPVIMCENQAVGDPDYWICDGCHDRSCQKKFNLKVISIVRPPLQYETAGPEYGPYYMFNYNSLHYNWCDGTQGWYLSTLSPRHPSVFEFTDIHI